MTGQTGFHGISGDAPYLAQVVDEAQFGHGELVLNDSGFWIGGDEKDVDLPLLLHRQREGKVAERVEGHRHLGASQRWVMKPRGPRQKPDGGWRVGGDQMIGGRVGGTIRP